MGCVWSGSRIEFQTMRRRRPLLRFVFGMDFLIWIASTVLLCQLPLACLWTVALDCSVDAVVCLLNIHHGYNMSLGLLSVEMHKMVREIQATTKQPCMYLCLGSTFV